MSGENTELTPLQNAVEAAQSLDGTLFDRVSTLIDQTRSAVATQANLHLTLMHWHIGRLIDVELLHENRAGYDQEIVASLARQLTDKFGRGFTRANLYRMLQFSQVYPDPEIVASMGRQLSWTHFTVLIAVPSTQARDFYAQQAISGRLSVRALRDLIGRQGYERKEIANVQTVGSAVVPADTFRDPYFLDFLGLPDAYAEQDLEDAIARDMQSFLLETGDGWAFVARQKRMPIGNDDFYLDLLFFSRPLKRLIAVELKLGHFKASYKGQMDLYLKWLNRHERQPGEETPLGLILCTEASREQIELLELHKDGIMVAEYWTALPPKKELLERITQIYHQAQERLARTQITTAHDESND
ncbi:DUF1016 domain-containing protein [Nesterenkonia sp. MY13]|uniref:DUF1016 domain-containing protein n=1 Tax=Nesterenkonia sedimenti TaxID=1463632 RepID=A0A7X8TKZ5_9MICC|nr:PDDEXK nuclease domain-containing protein [Nesterenkonia sedimenti]NLS10715.1 DUF1016 domain-containing protein [Nesterenkonia sedimenti]